MEGYDVPLYIADQPPQDAFDALLTKIASKCHNNRTLVEEFVTEMKPPAYDVLKGPQPTESRDFYFVKQAAVDVLFEAIEKEDNQSITLLFQHRLVSAAANDSRTQGTPLLQAISQKPINIGIVKQLLLLGADPNAFGYPDSEKTQCYEKRTPLMLAATQGSLPVIRLLFEPPYSVDDSMVAPDGEIALHLALVEGHRAIVNYLPLRRAGGYLRYKTRNKENIRRIQSALSRIYGIGKLFLWTIPKFFIWTLPKFILWTIPYHYVKKLGFMLHDMLIWCWANKKRCILWCKQQIVELPKRAARAGKVIWNGMKKVPNAIVNGSKALWKLGTRTLPRWGEIFAIWIWNFPTQTLSRWLWTIAKWLWQFLTVRLPKVIHATSKWIWSGITSFSRAIWEIISTIFSLLHTVLQAILTFLRQVTLRDIWNAICDLFRALFIILPQTIWSWIMKFGELSYHILDYLFGWTGRLIWGVCNMLKDVVVYIPRQFWIIIVRIMDSLGIALHEIRVWINPKA